MAMQITITDKGSTVGQWSWDDKVFSTGKEGYFTNGALNVRLFHPRIVITNDAGETVVDRPITAREFTSGKVGFYIGGPDWVIGDDKYGVLQFSAQIITSADKRTGRPITNRHRFQVMAYSL